MPAAHLIVNPSAVERHAGGMLPEMVSTFEQHGWQVQVFETEWGNTCTDLARSAIAAGCRLVVAAGGDGTVGEVAAGLLSSRVPLGILPLGTFNNIAHGLGIPIDLSAALHLVLHGAPRDTDVGLANNVPFFEVAGIGLDASLLPLGEDIKGGRYQRLLAAGLAFLRQTPTEMLVVLDGEEMTVHTPLVVVANGQYYGAGFTAAPGATMRDGVFEVAIFECGIVEMARHYTLGSQNRPHHESCVSVYSAREVMILPSTPLPAHADGKPLGSVPLTCRVLHGALRVIAP